MEDANSTNSTKMIFTNNYLYEKHRTHSSYWTDYQFM